MNPDDRLTCSDLLLHPYMDHNKDIFDQPPKREKRVNNRSRAQHNYNHLQQVRISVFQRKKSSVRR